MFGCRIDPARMTMGAFVGLGSELKAAKVGSDGVTVTSAERRATVRIGPSGGSSGAAPLSPCPISTDTRKPIEDAATAVQLPTPVIDIEADADDGDREDALDDAASAIDNARTIAS